MARGSRILGESRYAEAAPEAADFLLSTLCVPEGKLFHRWGGGESGVQANLADYAFLSLGLLELFQAFFEPRHLAEALALLETAVELFWDPEEGGFYFTPADGERLLARSKESVDGALPSGNSAALLALAAASRITGEPRWEELARRTAAAFAGFVEKQPAAHTFFVTAGMYLLGPAYEIVVAGSPQGTGTADIEAMLDRIGSVYLPNKVVVVKRSPASDLESLAPYMSDMEPPDGRATVYVCRDFACELPVTDPAELESLLERVRADARPQARRQTEPK